MLLMKFSWNVFSSIWKTKKLIWNSYHIMNCLIDRIEPTEKYIIGILFSQSFVLSLGWAFSQHGKSYNIEKYPTEKKENQD